MRRQLQPPRSKQARALQAALLLPLLLSLLLPLPLLLLPPPALDVTLRPANTW